MKEHNPLNAIQLEPTLMQQVEQVAAEQTATPDQIVEMAVRAYLRQLDRARIKMEAETYHSMHANLVKQYLNQYVAIYNRQLVDHGENFQQLHTRIRQRFGRQPVLLRRKEIGSEHELLFRSPRYRQVDLLTHVTQGRGMRRERRTNLHTIPGAASPLPSRARPHRVYLVTGTRSAA